MDDAMLMRLLQRVRDFRSYLQDLIPAAAPLSPDDRPEAGLRGAL
jgi:hypothetical protein